MERGEGKVISSLFTLESLVFESPNVAAGGHPAAGCGAASLTGKGSFPPLGKGSPANQAVQSSHPLHVFSVSSDF